MKRACTLLFAGFLFGVFGCGDKPPPGPERFPVSGTIKYKDKPLTGATIQFTPIGDTFGFPASGRTDEHGQYQVIDIRNAKGLVAGEFKVTISRRLLDGKEVPADDPTPPIESKASESLPPIYSDEGRTQLRAKVKNEPTTIDFDLK